MKRLSRPLKLHEVQKERKDDCEHYEDCLTRASTCRWPSFSCTGCDRYSNHSQPKPKG